MSDVTLYRKFAGAWLPSEGFQIYDPVNPDRAFDIAEEMAERMIFKYPNAKIIYK